jgi:putative transcriptional regulator
MTADPPADPSQPPAEPSAEPAAGRLLVASPALLDPNFARSVVLLLDHNEEGTLGVILNRPTELAVRDILSGWAELTTGPGVVFQGGPVGLDSALGLAQLGPSFTDGDEEPLGWRQLYGSIGLVDLGAPPEVLAGSVRSLRIFAGYAGWGSGQLDAELAQGAWYVVDSLADDAFSLQPERLWRGVLRRQRGELAFVATAPDDPSLN